MSHARPKRKATANKNYSDTPSESLFDSTSATSSTSSKSSAMSRSANNHMGSTVVKSPRKRGVVAAGKHENGHVSASASGRRTGHASTTSASSLASFPSSSSSSSSAASSSSLPASFPPGPLDAVPYNWQPPVVPAEDFSHKLDLTDATVNTALQVLTCPRYPAIIGVQREEHELKFLQNLLVKHSGMEPEPVGSRRKQPRACFQIRKGDYIYMVSEPPGEPYYIGRVKGFKRKDEHHAEKEIESAANYVFQIQWFYRPRDISKHTLDSRLLFASMHSDSCPLSSFRGLLTVLHRSDVETYFQPPKGSQLQWSNALEFYSSFPNCFYFDKLYDRYILKFFDVVKTSTLLPYIDNTANCSRNFILALNKRFEFVSMESARTKVFLNNFTSKMSTHCDVCAEWCGSTDSVTCAGCEKHFHMLCLDPPLMKKPSRGFSWSCAVCTKKHELEYQSRKILMLSHDNRSSNEEEISHLPESLPVQEDVAAVSVAATEPTKKASENFLPKYEQMAIDYLKKDASVSVLERRLKEEWSMRYLGLHARLEEAVDLFDRSYYPRVSTSLGQRYQVSNIPEFVDHPIVYYDAEKSAAEKNKKKQSNGKKNTKKKVEVDNLKELPIPKEFQGVQPKEFPQWLQPRPKGYIERGVDDGTGETCTLMWKPSPSDVADDFGKLDSFIISQDPVADNLGLHPNSPNFVDAILKAYMDCEGDTDKAAEIVSRLTRASLKEPTFTKEEVKRFEAGVKKHGSELYPVSKEVRTQSTSMTVRFYYIWKKTDRGHLIWGNYPGRKKKPNKDVEMKIKPTVDDYADSEDDSAYENDKIILKKKPFQCKHCKSYKSQKWFKITGFDGTTTHDDTNEIDDVDPACVVALCFRCAKIWRRYAVYWEDPVEVEKKNARGIGGYRKKVESELVADSEKILSHARNKGVALSYDLGRTHPESSVIDGFDRPKLVNGHQKSSVKPTQTPILIEDEVKPPSKQLPKTSGATKNSTKTKKLISAPSEESSSQKPAEPAKKASEDVPEKTSTKRRKVDIKITPEPPKTERAKKRQAAVKAEPNTKTKKKKTSPDIEKIPETPVKKEPEEIVKPERPQESKNDAKIVPARRQRKNADTTVLANPIFNSNYEGKLEEALSYSKGDKKGLPPLTKERLETVLDEFKSRQLLDMKSLVQGWQAPQQAKIDLPFSPNERKCSVCLEHDSLDTSSQEVLICSNCGVNVHGSCAGIAVSGKVKPARQWLCDPCVNDMGPKFSTNYSCSICLAKSTNTESAILGNPSEKPDFLVPIIESGRWCHMICALFCHEKISFRNVSAPNFIPKEIMASTNTKSLGCMVESVSRVFAENFDKSCGICKSFNGGLINCDLCEDKGKVYHVTCAQDTPNFKLGFKLVPQRITKLHTSTIVRDKTGKLVPILVCPEHDQKGTVLDIREQGKRSSAGEMKPLIQLFMEDLMRHGSRMSGPQLRAHNYISMIATLMDKVDRQNGKKNESSERGCAKMSCHFCKISSSPKWWPLDSPHQKKDGLSEINQESSKNRDEGSVTHKNCASLDMDKSFTNLHACQKCHVLGADREQPDSHTEGDKFMFELNKPIQGDHYGIKDMNDRIDYTPYEVQTQAVERSKITWGDLLG
ncbi:hypothetical protein JCM33374_g2511 [Metschnikowia sp. JCM 33374]|nr:hypothetical protein JCM33374_g2511 [Metschnikowia sp. JCM 33374]